ncbi:hypothetical protein HMPREF3155_09660 [Corynebacterium sp. HMSC06D04]|nr:hypothetical protein HMPREF2724_00105 [Corynebacterium sp. HMSC071F07]OFQ43376.1 hypothetical protein HMPREF2935_09025 [Corynebacterium sp. HMSC076D02]OFR39228.1 hypothetical protein HMPREF2888_09300 [Corynebacterium sp. HMSC077D03]OFT32688.1 hypothetical protein HMPREF3169_09065 [Corynebacterium sp. HMSC08C04]OFT50133.1 hypothetical protein HMPREF3155_09660 [Corynebacterium sp. HMSC06D04]
MVKIPRLIVAQTKQLEDKATRPFCQNLLMGTKPVCVERNPMASQRFHGMTIFHSRFGSSQRGSNQTKGSELIMVERVKAFYI